MRQYQKAGVALLAGLAGLACGGATLAQTPSGAPTNEPAGTEPRQPGSPEAQPGGQQGNAPGCGDMKGKHQGLGAGIGGGQFVLGPLDTSAIGAPQGAYGAGVGPSGEPSGEMGSEGGMPGRPIASAPAPVPQYWLADASLFVANAGNAAQTLANEQALSVQAPSVLGNQAQFLVASTDRALSSLAALEANAASTHPRALAEIRGAMDELTAAKAQAQQALDAANAGVLGPSHQATIRSAYEHLQSAEKQIGTVGRTYGAPGYTLASACSFRGKGLGVGLGGGKAVTAPSKAAPEKGTPEKTAPEKSAPAPEKVTPPENNPPPAQP